MNSSRSRKARRAFTRATDLRDRRAFLAQASQGLLGVAALPAVDRLLPPTDPSDAAIVGTPTAHRAIHIYLSGGLTHLDTFDPKPGNEVMGDTEVIGSSADGIQVGAGLPLLARQMDKVAVINSMWSNQGAHQQGRYFAHTSYELRGTIRHPSMGAWLSHVRGAANPTLPAHVLIGGGTENASSGFLASSHAPLPIGDPEAGLQFAERPTEVDDEAFERRMRRLQRMNREFTEHHANRLTRAYDEAYVQAVELMRSRDLAAFDLGAEPDLLRDVYGRNKTGQACLLARRLAEHDVRFVEVTVGGWDMHTDIFDALDDRLPEFDRALAALLADLDGRGLLDDTLVIVSTEFGRTPRIQADRGGRDHHPKAFSCLLAGGGIKRGYRHGRTDARGEEVVDGRVTVKDFNATIAAALGLPTEHEFHSPSGRPFTVANKGRPVAELFA